MARLSRTDWLDAGFRALTEIGPNAVRVEPIARAIGATKGSFYWHFKDLRSFEIAMLEYWEEAATKTIIDELSNISHANQRLKALIAIVSSAPVTQGGAGVEAAIRGWARSSEIAADALRRVDGQRLGFVSDCFQELGQPAETAVIFYAAYLGLEELSYSGRNPDYNCLKTLLARLLDQSSS